MQSQQDVSILVEELSAANQRLEARNRELERIGKSKDEFLAALSHELRTPVQVVSGYCDLLLQGESGDLSEAQRCDVETIDKAARQLLRIADEVEAARRSTADATLSA